MAARMTQDQAQARLEQYSSRFELVCYVPGGNQPSTFLDKETGNEVEYQFGSFLNKLKNNPNFVPREKRHTSQTAKETLARVTDNYALVEFVPGKKTLSTFYDKVRDREVKARFNNVVQCLKRNPNYIICPTPEDISEIRRKGIQKTVNSNLEKYGVEYPLQAEEVKNKIKETNLERYGAENPFSSPEIIEKIKAHNLEKYGVEWNSQSEEWRAKVRENCRKNFGADTFLASKIIQNKCKQSRINNGNVYLVDGIPLSEIAAQKGVSYGHVKDIYLTLGEEAVRWVSPNFNYLEDYMRVFIEELGVSYVYDKQLPGSSYRPDFVLPDHNLIIECDGLYWHSDKIIKDNKYHQKKLEKYEDLGYRALFFREDEIRNKFGVVCAIIQNALKNNNKRVFARKCALEEISNNFFVENHLMGKGRGKCFGLVYEGVIVAGMQACVVNKEKGLLDISRFCSSPGVSVVGGFSKLVKHFQKVYNCRVVQTFIDRRYGSGDYLSDLGFENITNHVSFKWVDYSGKETFHRMKFKKNTGYDHGLYKIWDCGQSKWVKEL